MKLLIIKCTHPLKSGDIRKYEDEINRMLQENGYLILPPGFEPEVVEADNLSVQTVVPCEIAKTNESITQTAFPNKCETNEKYIKYEFTGETKFVPGTSILLHRIRALVDIDFNSVAAGEIGGWIEKESNLSHNGAAWISQEAMVFGNARVFGNSLVCGSAIVYGDAKVHGTALVHTNAEVFGDSDICDREVGGFKREEKRYSGPSDPTMYCGGGGEHYLHLHTGKDTK